METDSGFAEKGQNFENLLKIPFTDTRAKVVRLKQRCCFASKGCVALREIADGKDNRTLVCWYWKV